MLFENHRRTHRSFETVHSPSFDDLTERANRAAVLLPVVRERTEEPLYFQRGVEPLDEFPLGGREAFCVGNHA